MPCYHRSDIVQPSSYSFSIFPTQRRSWRPPAGDNTKWCQWTSHKQQVRLVFTHLVFVSVRWIAFKPSWWFCLSTVVKFHYSLTTCTVLWFFFFFFQIVRTNVRNWRKIKRYLVCIQKKKDTTKFTTMTNSLDTVGVNFIMSHSSVKY